MSPESPEAPRLTRAILTLLLPGGGIRESVLGDLEEMYRARVLDRGVHEARRWYRAQAWGIALGYAGRRIRGVRAPAFAPAPRVREVREDGMKDLWTGLAITLRSLARSPGFTLPALAILAAGMTAATAIFTVVDSIVFRPLDFHEANRLVMVCEDHPSLRGVCIASPGVVDELQHGNRSLTELGIARSWPYTLDTDGEVRTITGGLVSAAALRAFGVRPLVGRLFRDDEHGPDRDKVVILGHGMWTTEYGADPDVLGRTMILDGLAHEIVGVLEEGFEPPFDMGRAQFWRPIHFDPTDPDVRGWRGFRAVGRLAEGATTASTQADLSGVYRSFGERYEEVTDEWRLRVTPLLDVVLGSSRRVLMTFLGAAGVLLLIVCANVANLILARGLGRRREMAVRAALGAARGRLVQGILVESLVLTVGATVVALACARLATDALLGLAPPIPRLQTVTMDVRIFGFSALMALVVTLVFALLPALRVTGWNLAGTIRSGARAGEGLGVSRLRSTLVVAELALSVALLAGAGILARSFIEYTRWDPAFEKESLLAFSAFANATGLTREEMFTQFRLAQERLEALPGVRSASVASAGPLFGGSDGSTQYAVEGSSMEGELPSVWWYDAGPRYFATLGLPVIEGREFNESDSRDVARVAVVNRTMARAAWPEGNAVGGVIHLPDLERTLTVVGVVEDIEPITPDEAVLPMIWFSHRQYGRAAPFFVVRAEGDPAALLGTVTDAVEEVVPDMSLGTPRLLSVAEEDELVRPRFQALVLGAFALVALALSAIGVYAVVAYSVARRIPEMGIRMALGAGAGDVVWAVFRSSLAVTLVGLLIGLGLSVALGGTLEGMVHGVAGTDPLSLGGAMLLLLGLTSLAAYFPARRATRADPVSVIRAD